MVIFLLLKYICDQGNILISKSLFEGFKVEQPNSQILDLGQIGYERKTLYFKTKLFYLRG